MKSTTNAPLLWRALARLPMPSALRALGARYEQRKGLDVKTLLRHALVFLRTLWFYGPRYVRCPEHGRTCRRKAWCCCRDLHWRPWASYNTNADGLKLPGQEFA